VIAAGASKWQHDQEHDEVLKIVRHWLDSGQRPDWKDVTAKSPVLKSYWSLFNSLEKRGQLFYHRLDTANQGLPQFQLVVPKIRQEPVIKHLPDKPVVGISE
jgi:hypothetical protein